MTSLEPTLFLTKGRSTWGHRRGVAPPAFAGSRPYVRSRVEVLLFWTCPTQVCSRLCPLSALGFISSRDNGILSASTRKEGGCISFQAVALSSQALTMAWLIATGWRRLTVSLNFVVCTFFFSVKRKGAILSRIQHIFSSPQSLNSLEVCSSYKNNFASWLCPSEAKVSFSGTVGWRFLQKSILPVNNNDKCHLLSTFSYDEYEASLFPFLIKNVKDFILREFRFIHGLQKRVHNSHTPFTQLPQIFAPTRQWSKTANQYSHTTIKESTDLIQRLSISLFLCSRIQF